jgi:hypothetical protein
VLWVEVLIAVYTMCKSSVSVNHLHDMFKFVTFTLILLQCIYNFLHSHEASVNVLGRVTVNTTIMCKVTLVFEPPFTQTLFSGVSIK